MSAQIVMALLLGGALIAVVCGSACFFIGRATGDPGGMQARVTVRELMYERKLLQKQLAAIRDAVTDVLHDFRTEFLAKQAIESRVLPLLTERSRD